MLRPWINSNQNITFSPRSPFHDWEIKRFRIGGLVVEIALVLPPDWSAPRPFNIHKQGPLPLSPHPSPHNHPPPHITLAQPLHHPQPQVYPHLWPEPPRYTWRSTCRTFVYVTSVTWQAFTRRNYCVTHDCVTSMCVKCIWMTKVSKSWRNKTMTHINKTRITLTWRHKYINVTHVTPKNKYMTYDYMT